MPVRECNWYGSRKVDKDEAGIFYFNPLNAGGVIRTRGLLRDRVLSPAPFPDSATPAYNVILFLDINVFIFMKEF